MSGSSKPITRRAALARLGLAVGAAYCSPALTQLSSAQAASAPSALSEPSEASAPSAPSRVSRPTAPTAPTAPSRATRPSTPSGSETISSSNRNDRNRSTQQQGCSAPSGSEGIGISSRDNNLANEAVARGTAKPLREIFDIVQRNHKGQLIRVGFNQSGGGNQYWIRMVSPSGAVQTVTVDALTGRTLRVGGC